MGPYVYACTVTVDEDGRFLVRFPQFPEALTDGVTEQEALVEAEDCLREALSQRLKRGEDIPDPARVARGEYPVRVAPDLSVKIALSRIMCEQRLTVADLARRLGIDHKEGRRLLDPYEATKMSRLVHALVVLGYGVETTIYDRSRRMRALAPVGGQPNPIVAGSATRMRRRPVTG